jgi:phosphoribosylanthranilate isomerase
MMPQVLARHIANLTDARYFAAKEVTWLAFQLDPNHPMYLDPSLMQAMRAWVQGPGIAGEFAADAPAAEVRAAADFYPLDAVIVGPSTAIDLRTERMVIVRLPAQRDVVEDFTLKYPNPTMPLLLEPSPTGTDWMTEAQWIEPIAKSRPVWLVYEAAPDQLVAVLEATSAVGIGLAGSEEEQVGMKTFDDIEAIFEVLETT